MNQQRQTTPATIDLTPAHQVLRARIMGAIDCDPRFRVKTLNLEGSRTSSDPFSIGSDTIANQCAASDLLVSFDGSTTYMLQCEVKTTRKKFGDKTAPEIFRDIKHVEYPDSGKRNLRQFEKLCGGGSHYWWYVIAQVHGLNEDDHDLLESKIGDQPAILVEGKAPYPEAMRQYGPMRLNALLKVVRERTGALAEMFPMDQKSPMLFNPPSRKQLAFPIDDVPAVTMNTPLKVVTPHAQSASATEKQDCQPQQSPNLVENATPHRAERFSPPALASESIEDCLAAMSSVKVSTEEIRSRMNADELSAHAEIMKLFSHDRHRVVIANMIRRMAGASERGSFSPIMLTVLDSDIALLSIAVHIVNCRLKQEKGLRSRSRHNEVFAEFVLQRAGLRRNIANLVAGRLCQK